MCAGPVTASHDPPHLIQYLLRASAEQKSLLASLSMRLACQAIGESAVALIDYDCPPSTTQGDQAAIGHAHRRPPQGPSRCPLKMVRVKSRSRATSIPPPAIRVHAQARLAPGQAAGKPATVPADVAACF